MSDFKKLNLNRAYKSAFESDLRGSIERYLNGPNPLGLGDIADVVHQLAKEIGDVRSNPYPILGNKLRVVAAANAENAAEEDRARDAADEAAIAHIEPGSLTAEQLSSRDAQPAPQLAPVPQAQPVRDGRPLLSETTMSPGEEDFLVGFRNRRDAQVAERGGVQEEMNDAYQGGGEAGESLLSADELCPACHPEVTEAIAAAEEEIPF